MIGNTMMTMMRSCISPATYFCSALQHVQLADAAVGAALSGCPSPCQHRQAGTVAADACRHMMQQVEQGQGQLGLGSG
jgi:hypothetical protein